jgi:hypothetical protein
MANRLGVRCSGARVRLDAGHFCFLRNVHSVSCSGGTRFLFSVVKEPSREATTHLHLALRLRISGAITLLPLYVFMAWAGISSDCLHILRVGIPSRFTVGFDLIYSE